MHFIDYNGATLALLLVQPNWSHPVKVELAVPWAEITEARAGDEDRQPFGESARYTIEYVVDTSSARESTDLKMWLMRLRDEQVAVPMWADYVEAESGFNIGTTSIPLSHGPPVNHGNLWVIMSQDGALYEIVVRLAVTPTTLTLAAPGTTLNWPAGTRAFPLLFGHILNEDRPKFKRDTAELLNGTIKVRESSPWDRRLSPFDPGGSQVCGAGLPNFFLTPLFNVRPHHSEPIETVDVDLLLTQLGFGRELSKYAGPYAAVRGMEHTFLQMSRAEIAAVNWFYLNRQGPTLRFMAPTFMGDLRLTQNLPLGDPKLITIEDSRYTDEDFSTNPGAPFLALNDPDHITAVQVHTIDGVGLHLWVDLAQSYNYTGTKLSHLLLCRFAETKLTWTYDADALASCKLRFIEVSNEYTDPPAEKGPAAYLLKFIEKVDVDVTLATFTSYERSITAWSATWQPAPFALGTFRETLDLGDKLQFATFDFDELGGLAAKNPLRKIIEGTLEGTLECEVIRVDPNNPEVGAVSLISGEVVIDDVDGKEIKAHIDPLGGVLDQDHPHFFKQKVCNVPTYSTYCRLNREDFRFDGVIPADWEDNKVLDILGGGGLGDKGDNHFSPGFIETGTGPTFERRSILDSDQITGGQRITLKDPLRKAADGQAVKIYPICNRTAPDCNARFDNILNFKAQQWAPTDNPSADIPATQIGAGGKKG